MRDTVKMNLPNSNELQSVIRQCRNGDKKAQQKLFCLAYPLGMSVCRRYSSDLEESKSIFNEGMLKVFQQLDRYSADMSFGGWVRKIMVNTAIDNYRRSKRYQERFSEIDEDFVSLTCDESILDKISAEELLGLIQQLPPSYRMVFTLYAVEEYTHRDIADKLGISEGTSKSNYAKAKAKLQKALVSIQPGIERNYGKA